MLAIESAVSLEHCSGRTFVSGFYENDSRGAEFMRKNDLATKVEQLPWYKSA